MSTATDISVADALIGRFEGVSLRTISRDSAVNVPAAKLLDVVQALRDEYGFEILTCVSGVDWLGQSPRFGVFYHFHSLSRKSYFCVYTDCQGDDENPSVPSLMDLYPSANWHEREAFDMYGIRFVGHRDLRRILMWEKYPYHPLRKEFPLAGMETELPVADIAQETKAKVMPAPEQGGPFHAKVGAAHMSEREPRGLDQSWSEAHPKP